MIENITELLELIIEKKKLFNYCSVKVNGDLDLYLSLKEKSYTYLLTNKTSDFDLMLSALTEAYSNDTDIPFEALASVLFHIEDKDIPIQPKESLAKLLEEYLVSCIHFNLSSVLLRKICALIRKHVGTERRISAVEKSLSFLTEIFVETENKFDTVAFELENINKIELTPYFSILSNYYIIPKSPMKIYKLIEGKLIEINSKYVKNADQSVYGYGILNGYVNYSYNKFEVKNQLNRIWMYIAFEDILHGRVPILNSEVSKKIEQNERLFDSVAFSKIYDLIIDSFGTYSAGVEKRIRQLKDKPTNSTLLGIVRNEPSTQNIYNILKRASYIIKEEIHFDSYVLFLNKCKEQDDYSLRIALLCEELLINRPIVIDDIVYFLKRMYEKEVFTKDTEKAIEFIKCTTDDEIVDIVLIKLQARESKFDLGFADKLIKIYCKTQDGSLDCIINKMVNSGKFYFNLELSEIIYDFYSRHDDVNALDVLIRKCFEEGIDLRETKVSVEDINNIFTQYASHNIINKDELYLKLAVLYEESTSAKDAVVMNIEEAVVNKDAAYITLLSSGYRELFYRWYKESEAINRLLLKLILKEDLTASDNTSERINILQYSLTKVDDNKKIEIIKKLIDFYSAINNEEKFIEALTLYLKEYSQLDEGNLFQYIIFSEVKNIKTIKSILEKLNFNDIKISMPMLNLIGRRLIQTNEIETLIQILNYHVNNPFAIDIDIIKAFINEMKEITLVDYMIVEKVFRGLEYKEQKEIYELLCRREDMPPSLREEFFFLMPSEENEKAIAGAYLDSELDSLFAKEKACECFYYEDEIFLEVIEMPETGLDRKIREMVLKKAEEKLSFNKDYALQLLYSIEREDDTAEKLINILEYDSDSNDKEERVVFDKFKRVSCIKGEFINKLQLINLFHEDYPVREAMFIKNDLVGQCIKNYLEDNKISYEQIDYDCISISEEITGKEMFRLDFKDFIISIRKLFKLQQNLISSGAMMVYFGGDAFKIASAGFIPNKLEMIAAYEERVIIRDVKELKVLPEIINSNGYAVINEENIVKLIRSYLCEVTNYLTEYMNMKKSEDDNNKADSMLVKKLFDNLINNSELKTYEACIQQINNMLWTAEKQFEELSLRKQIKTFDTLGIEEKSRVFDYIVSKKNTTADAKKIVLNWNENKEDNAGVFAYLTECFIRSCQGLDEGDLQRIYSKVVNILKHNKAYLAEEADREDLKTLFIKAKEKTGFSKSDIIRDVEEIVLLDQEDREYVISRIKLV